MGTVFANGRVIIHKGDGLQHTAAPPDVCKTPSPGGPVPVPYVNVAMDSNLASGAKKVKIEGSPVALASSNLSTSMGDEPGTAGGVVSSKFKGKLTWGTSSGDVKFEGKGVVRFMDVTQHNGNSFNSAFVDAGHTGFAYGDDTPCFICSKPYDNHLVKESKATEARSKDFVVELIRRMTAQQADVMRAVLLNNENRRLTTDRRSKALKGGKNAERRAALDATIAANELEFEAINTRLAANHVLKLDVQKHSRTYSLGYMMGVLNCKCGQKQFVAMSGGPTPGFRAAVGDATADLVEGMPDFSNGAPVANSSGPLSEEDRATYMARLADVVPVDQGQRWECAAPQLIQACQATGHKPGEVTEMFFSPIQVQEDRVPGPNVKYQRDGEPVSQKFGHGETVPSCSRCQILLPPMLCDTKDSECP